MPPLPPGTDRAEAAVREEGLRAAVRFLADDLLEGRGPGSRGDLLARRWIASQLEGMGYRPGGPDGKWEQPFAMVGVTASAGPEWRFTRGDKREVLRGL